jgi:hypothetical protein
MFIPYPIRKNISKAFCVGVAKVRATTTIAFGL